MENIDKDELRRLHIEGFVDSFVNRTTAERYRSLLLDAKRRSKITDAFNHRIGGDLVAKHIVTAPPRFKPDATAYVISDEKDFDDTFVDATSAIQIVENAYFGTVASLIPGVLALLKEEAPAKVVWLYRPESH